MKQQFSHFGAPQNQPPFSAGGQGPFVVAPPSHQQRYFPHSSQSTLPRHSEGGYYPRNGGHTAYGPRGCHLERPKPVPPCEHPSLAEAMGPTNCKSCGVFMSSNGYVAVRASERKGGKENVAKIMASLAEESKCAEKQRRLGASYAEYRGLLINWLVVKAEECGLSKMTQHHAVAIMDALMSKVELKDQDLKLVTACSLHISAKLNEKEVDIPTLDSIWQRSVTFYTALDIKLMEMFIMSRLDNNFYYLPVPLRTLQAFLDQGALFPACDSLPAAPFAAAQHFQNAAHFIADFHLLQLPLLRISATQAAASILAVTRRVIGIEPVWSDQLQELTKIPLEEFAELANSLYSGYMVRFAQATPFSAHSQPVVQHAPLFDTTNFKKFQSPTPSNREMALLSTDTGSKHEGGWQSDLKKNIKVPAFYSQPQKNYSDMKENNVWSSRQNPFAKAQPHLGILVGGDVEMDDYEDCREEEDDIPIDIAIANAEIVVEDGLPEKDESPFH